MAYLCEKWEKRTMVFEISKTQALCYICLLYILNQNLIQTKFVKYRFRREVTKRFSKRVT